MSSDQYEDEELRKLLQQREKEILARSMQEELSRKAEEEAMKKALTRLYFSPEARQRLANLKLVKPKLASQLEEYLLALAQQGRLPTPIDDETLKKILRKIYEQKRETKITRL